MWRIWTKGYGFRHWWYWLRTQGFPYFVVNRILPKRIVLCAFVTVCASSMDCPSEEFKLAWDNWVNKYKLDGA